MTMNQQDLQALSEATEALSKWRKNAEKRVGIQAMRDSVEQMDAARRVQELKRGEK